MTDSKLSESDARRTIRSIDPNLESQFACVVSILNRYPSLRPTLRGRTKADTSNSEYLSGLAKQFSASREPRAPQAPQTIPDSVVGTILAGYYDIPSNTLNQIAHTHSLSMAAENLVGDLLERYIADALEPIGWTWCSGSVVRSVDFIGPVRPNLPQILLQVKNRDNSENSSSSAVRDGTDIQKWFRSFSRRPATNWGAFPDVSARSKLSETGFNSYVRVRMLQIRPKDKP
jgi:hypothetical protein